MRTFDFFEHIADFREVVPGIDASSVFEEMQASHERSKKKITDVITASLYNELLVAHSGAADPEKTEAIKLLQPAHGNLIAYFDIPNKVVAKKKEGVNYYKYELQKIEETYLDSFATFMDSLLDYLDANAAYFTDWANSNTYKNRQGLILKTADAFNNVFPTGGSAYFFSLIAPLQHQVIEIDILPRYALADIPETLTKTVEYFVAYKTMAKAALLVDYADLPKSLRQKLYLEESKKQYENESMSERYANQFNAEADRYLAKIDFELQKPASDVNEVTPTSCSINDEDDQTYVIV